MNDLFYELYGLELGLDATDIMDFDELDEYDADNDYESRQIGGYGI